MSWKKKRLNWKKGEKGKGGGERTIKTQKREKCPGAQQMYKRWKKNYKKE